MVAVRDRQAVAVVVNEIVNSTVEIKPLECFLLRVIELLFTISEVSRLENENDLVHSDFLQGRR